MLKLSLTIAAALATGMTITQVADAQAEDKSWATSTSKPRAPPRRRRPLIRRCCISTRFGTAPQRSSLRMR